MNDTPEMIRRQMDATRSQLSEKIESLETQVSDTFQSTGDAMNNTVEAIQKTFETVTGAVQDAADCAHNAFDIRRQIHKHPWLVVGGCVAVGYLAAEFLTAPGTKTDQLAETALPPCPATNSTVQGNKQPAVKTTAKATSAVDFPSDRGISPWHQLRDGIIGALISAVPGIASQIAGRLMDSSFGARADNSQNSAEIQGSTRLKEASEAAHSLQFASSENVRSRKLF